MNALEKYAAKRFLIEKLAAAKAVIKGAIGKPSRARKLKSLGFANEEEFAEAIAKHGKDSVPGLSDANRLKGERPPPKKKMTRKEALEAYNKKASDPWYIPKGKTSPTSEASMARDAAKRRLAGIE